MLCVRDFIFGSPISITPGSIISDSLVGLPGVDLSRIVDSDVFPIVCEAVWVRKMDGGSDSSLLSSRFSITTSASFSVTVAT